MNICSFFIFFFVFFSCQISRSLLKIYIFTLFRVKMNNVKFVIEHYGSIALKNALADIFLMTGLNMFKIFCQFSFKYLYPALAFFYRFFF